jgi:hypothetical protein
MTCRQDHLWVQNVLACDADVWIAEKGNFTPSSASNGSVNMPGCRGTCGNIVYYQQDVLGKEIKGLSNPGRNRYDLPMQAEGVYCIGPGYVPLDKTKFPPQPLGGGNLKDYIAANTSNWPNAGGNDERNWDSIGNAAVVMYTVFYRSSWVEPMQTTAQSATQWVVLGWIIVMIFTSYYLLNITVSITCAYYSEATIAEMEAVEKANKAKLELTSAVVDEDDEDAEGENQQGDDNEQDLKGFDSSLARDKVYKDMQTDKYPSCGNGCDLFRIPCGGCCWLCGKVATAITNKYTILKICANPLASVYQKCGKGFRICCHTVIRFAARCALPSEGKKASGDDDEGGEEDKGAKQAEDEPTKRGSPIVIRFRRIAKSIQASMTRMQEGFQRGAPVSVISVICMFGCMLTQGLQNANINLYKCECTDDDIMRSQDLTQMMPCDADGLCLVEALVDGQMQNVTTSLYKCIADVCVFHARQGYPCMNPWYNPLLALASKRLNNGAILQPSADEWMIGRKQWCTLGTNLHLALYGFAIIFLLELLVRYIAHQGFIQFFTMNLYGRRPGILGNVNYSNIVDTVCILATVAGIAITEFSASPTQILLANVSYFDPDGVTSPGVPWIFKLLRLATLIRLAIRTPALKSIPMVAVILRGFRGAGKVLFGVTVLIIMVFFFALLGKELFDFGYSNMNSRFRQLSDFSDLSQSIIPLLEIMVGSGWYDYLRAGVRCLGIIGFLYFALFFFIVNFQFLRIFIAIIVQNYEVRAACIPCLLPTALISGN